MKTYKAKNGQTQYKPSVKELEQAENDGEGFCLACGETAEGVEPDAVRYTCECCGANKVYGPASLAMMGLYY